MASAASVTTPDPRLALDRDASPPVLSLHGRWTQSGGLPDTTALLASLPEGASLTVRAGELERWDTTLAAFLRGLERALESRGGHLLTDELPAGPRRLLRLARAGRPPESKSGPKAPWIARVGAWSEGRIDRVEAWFTVAGLSFTALARFVSGRARVPVSDFIEQLMECGPRSLPIVTLLAFLIGGITAFVGVVQLRMFGAELYVADLVGMGMLLEMGALMTGIILAGRAGAAFAAALGTMQTNEEIDALQTLGFDPVEFLVMPRILALTLCAPLLTLYADLMGILGGAAVAVSLLDMSVSSYFVETAQALHLSDAIKGLIKSTVFGALIAFAGCLRGIECGRSAQAVGHATTSAVVTAIVLIVLSDAFVTVLIFMWDGML